MCVPVPTAETGVFNLKLKAGSSMIDLQGDLTEFFQCDATLLTTSVNHKFKTILQDVLHDSECWINEPYLEIDPLNDWQELDQSKTFTKIWLRTYQKIGSLTNDYFFTRISIDVAPTLQIKRW